MRWRGGFLIVLIGCGGKAGSGGVTTVAGSKPLGTLSTGEAEKLCNDVHAYYAAHISAVDACRYSAYVTVSTAASDPSLSDAALVADCTSAYDTCAAAAAKGAPPIDCGTPPPTFSGDCTATVAQYSTCVADEATATNQANLAVPACSELDRAAVDALNADGGVPGIVEPASCVAYQRACPAGILPLPP